MIDFDESVTNQTIKHIQVKIIIDLIKVNVQLIVAKQWPTAALELLVMF